MEIKSLEEQIYGKCIHFNGVQNESCGCGMNYKQNFGERPILRMPCLKDRMKHLKEDVIEWTTGQKMGSIKCPNGDHNLTYSQAEVNGHIRMACKTCEISVME